MLDLAEELLLLALEDESGRIKQATAASLPFGLAGAMLMDLTLRERLGMEDDRVVVLDASPTEDEVLDSALREISASAKPRNAWHWVSKLGSWRPKDRVTEQLLERGILKRQEDMVLWIFPYIRHLPEDATVERELRDSLQDVVLNGHAPDARSAALLSLIKSCNLVDDVFGRADRKRARDRLDEISERELIDNAVSDTVAAAQAATQAATTASVLAATTSATASCTPASSTSCQ